MPLVPLELLPPRQDHREQRDQRRGEQDQAGREPGDLEAERKTAHRRLKHRSSRRVLASIRVDLWCRFRELAPPDGETHVAAAPSARTWTWTRPRRGAGCTRAIPTRSVRLPPRRTLGSARPRRVAGGAERGAGRARDPAQSIPGGARQRRADAARGRDGGPERTSRAQAAARSFGCTAAEAP